MYADAIIENYAMMIWNVYLFITKRHIMTLEPILVLCVVKVDPQHIELSTLTGQ